MNRRTFLHISGAAAGACLVPRAFAEAPAPSVFPVTHVNHLSLVVDDVRRSRDFYVDVLGMRVAWDDGKMCGLEFGNVSAPNGMYVRTRNNPNEPLGANHIAFAMVDFMAHKAAMHAELERRGVKNLRPDGAVGWSFDDPAGYPLNVVVVKDPAMYPGAASLCGDPHAASCTDGYAAGTRNLRTPSSRTDPGLTATAFSHLVLNVADAGAETAFYRDLLGMKVLFTQNDPPESMLRFGDHTLWIRTLANAADKPVVNHFSFVVDRWDTAKVKAELDRRSLQATPNTTLGWTIKDPDGFVIDLAGRGWPERIAADCRRGTAKPGCPGGPDR